SSARLLRRQSILTDSSAVCWSCGPPPPGPGTSDRPGRCERSQRPSGIRKGGPTLIIDMTTSFETARDLVLDEQAQNLLFREARSANAFTETPVTDEQIAAIFDLVKWAPTSMNIQPLRVKVLRSEEAKARLLPHMSDGNRDKTAALNAGLQTGYAIIGIRAAGLAAGPMTGFDADAVTKEFFPDGRHRVMVAINIGEPAENAWMGRLPRLEYDEVVETL